MPYPLTRKAISYFPAWVRSDERSRSFIKADLSEAEAQALYQLEKNVHSINLTPEILLNNLSIHIKPETLAKAIYGLSNEEVIIMTKLVEKHLGISGRRLVNEEKAEPEVKKNGFDKLSQEDFGTLVISVMEESGCYINKKVSYDNVQVISDTFAKRGYTVSCRNVRALIQKARRYMGIRIPRGGRVRANHW